jgi:hypothetical protein
MLKYSEVFHFYYYTPTFLEYGSSYVKYIEITKVTISSGKDVQRRQKLLEVRNRYPLAAV